jgi:squalene synthase HpnC
MIRQVLRGGRAADADSQAGGAGAAADGTSAAGRPALRRPVPWLDPPEGPWPVERAYAYCEDFARAHHESYPVASRLIPAAMRPHVMAVYAFARSADDFADEPQFEGRRTEALERWEQELQAAAHGEATHPVFIALADTIEKRDLPVPPLQDLLSAFRMDMEVRRYANFSALRSYTARSAEPVGRLLLGLFGYRTPELVRFADEISTALQLTNFWQDVAADAARDHIYVPAEDMHFFGVTEAALKALRPTRETRELLRFQVARTRSLYERGRPLLRRLDNDLKLELALIWLIGTTILDKIEAADYDVFTHRPTITRRDKAMIMAKAAKHWASRLDLAALRKLWP